MELPGNQIAGRFVGRINSDTVCRREGEVLMDGSIDELPVAWIQM
jgi:hypothetical protein